MDNYFFSSSARASEGLGGSTMVPERRLVPARAVKESKPAAMPAARNGDAERRLALSRADAKLVVPHASTKAYATTGMTRGEVTPGYEALSVAPVLKVAPKPPPGSAESLATRKARKAALYCWHPSTNKNTAMTGFDGVRGEAADLVPASAEMRHWRRGESNSIPGSYRQASVVEVTEMIKKIELKQIKWTEVDKLHADGKSRVSGGTLRTYFYGKGAAEKRQRLSMTLPQPARPW